MTKIYLESLNPKVKPFLDTLTNEELTSLTHYSEDLVDSELSKPGVKAVKIRDVLLRETKPQQVFKIGNIITGETMVSKIISESPGDIYAYDSSEKKFYHAKPITSNYYFTEDVIRIYPGDYNIRFMTNTTEIIPLCKIEDFYIPMFNPEISQLYMLVEVPDNKGGETIRIECDFYTLSDQSISDLRIPSNKLLKAGKNSEQTSLRLL